MKQSGGGSVWERRRRGRRGPFAAPFVTQGDAVAIGAVRPAADRLHRQGAGRANPAHDQPALLGAGPDWLREPRGRDVNPDVTWIPFVTFWQLTTDMAVGHDPPDGYGHRYGAELVPAWGSVLGGSPTDDYSKIVEGVDETVNRVE